MKGKGERERERERGACLDVSIETQKLKGERGDHVWMFQLKPKLEGRQGGPCLDVSIETQKLKGEKERRESGDHVGCFNLNQKLKGEREEDKHIGCCLAIKNG